MNRSVLESLKTEALVDEQLEIHRVGEVHKYTLLSRLGPGKTAVAWKARDGLGRPCAIKFTLKEEYDNHSLEWEISRVNRLRSQLVARIDYYGEPQSECREIPWNDLYAIVVDWIEGPTLAAFLHDLANELDLDIFRQFAKDLCEILADLGHEKLMHNDLHDKNLIVSKQYSPLTDATTYRLVAIDTGQLKTEERRAKLLERWRNEVSTLQDVCKSEDDAAGQRITQLRKWIEYFGRTDHDWVVCHLCALYNRLHASLARTDSRTRRFLDQLPALLQAAADPDPSRRIDDPSSLHEQIEGLIPNAFASDRRTMQSPFDLPSAELIRSDRQLMDLFSEEYPRLDECRSNSPVYIYGPRGCGKSTILRSLSLKALLNSADPKDAVDKAHFIGVYLSCSSELRSRFWLFREEDYDRLEASIVRYFNLLLVDALAETLDHIFLWDAEATDQPLFGLNEDAAQRCCQAIRLRLDLDDDIARHHRASPLGQLRSQVRRCRDVLWKDILNGSQLGQRTDAQLIFDITRDMEELCPFLKERRLAFLLDDYSNQRIPIALQRKLNQSITFAKQGSPIFKVSSEYDGVDLAGIQEGREVREINVGSEYVSLKGQQRWQFLRNMLEQRFRYLECPVDMTRVLSTSGIEPATSMANAIATAHRDKSSFYYHGLDTISDVCSGDFAMGLDLVRKIFENSHTSWKSPVPISAHVQHRTIHEYAARELEYIRYRFTDGQRKYEIVERLCWLSRKCAIEKTRKKDGKEIPVVKNHIDVAETAIQELHRLSRGSAELLDELIRKGILFPLDPSRSREGHQGTRRYMMRRILLAHYDAPLGRDTPIRIDTLDRLRLLLSDPREFVELELASTSSRPKQQEDDSQQKLFDKNAPD